MSSILFQFALIRWIQAESISLQAFQMTTRRPTDSVPSPFIFSELSVEQHDLIIQLSPYIIEISTSRAGQIYPKEGIKKASICSNKEWQTAD